MKRILCALLLVSLASCVTDKPGEPAAVPANLSTMNEAAERYVKIVLAVGLHDTDYVDSYYGPPEWRTAAEAEKASLELIQSRALAVQRDLASIDPGTDAMTRLRHTYLSRQIAAVLFRIEMLQGKKFTFDQESKGLYDAVAPHHDEAFFEGVRQKLEAELPGEGELADRIDRYRSAFIIPRKSSTPFSRPPSAVAGSGPSSTSLCRRRRPSASST